ncbi:hypothetical protein BDZ88DRAFT_449829 [Geranomyces variabilis]|nr:hypothetical protein BDZ88DRAFT_449829 [Geranomyces variabilis]
MQVATAAFDAPITASPVHRVLPRWTVLSKVLSKAHRLARLSFIDWRGKGPLGGAGKVLWVARERLTVGLGEVRSAGQGEQGSRERSVDSGEVSPEKVGLLGEGEQNAQKGRRLFQERRRLTVDAASSVSFEGEHNKSAGAIDRLMYFALRFGSARGKGCSARKGKFSRLVGVNKASKLLREVGAAGARVIELTYFALQHFRRGRSAKGHSAQEKIDRSEKTGTALLQLGDQLGERRRSAQEKVTDLSDRDSERSTLRQFSLDPKLSLNPPAALPPSRKSVRHLCAESSLHRFVGTPGLFAASPLFRLIAKATL